MKCIVLRVIGRSDASGVYVWRDSSGTRTSRHTSTDMLHTFSRHVFARGGSGVRCEVK